MEIINSGNAHHCLEEHEFDLHSEYMKVYYNVETIFSQDPDDELSYSGIKENVRKAILSLYGGDELAAMLFHPELFEKSMENTKLCGCPFCGRPTTVYSGDIGGVEYYGVGCSDFDCYFYGTNGKSFTSKEEAIEEYNKSIK